jgi:hypothetical protein
MHMSGRSWTLQIELRHLRAFPCGCRSQPADVAAICTQIATRRGIYTDECPVTAAH